MTATKKKGISKDALKNVRDIITLKVLHMASKGAKSTDLNKFVKEQANFYCGEPKRLK